MPKKSNSFRPSKKQGSFTFQAQHICVFLSFFRAQLTQLGSALFFTVHIWPLAQLSGWVGGHGGDQPIKNQRAYKSSYLIFIPIIKWKTKSILSKCLTTFFRFVHRYFVGLFPTPLPLASREESDGMTINISF